MWVFMNLREGVKEAESKKHIVIHNYSLRERGQKSGVQLKGWGKGAWRSGEFGKYR